VSSQEWPLSVEVAQDFIGGSGFTVKYLYDEVPADCDPLGPENKLIYAPGPFTGTTIPCASRMAIGAKSPLSGTMGVATTGGHFPVEMKRPSRGEALQDGLHRKRAPGGRWPAANCAIEKLCKWNQDATAALADSCTMCVFIVLMALAGFQFENGADLMEGTTGLIYTPEEVHQVGERINNLAKVFNTLAGFTRADDDLPERLKTEPIPDGPSKGHMISQVDLDLMLDEYYDARGWNREGVPTRAKLEELRLGYAADKLGL
jgi:aldehyde:ferredoxin oxidoreductase